MSQDKAKEIEKMAEVETEKLREKVGKAFGTNGLDFLDDLPNPPKKTASPFPYGSSGAKPYGWFSN